MLKRKSVSNSNSNYSNSNSNYSKQKTIRLKLTKRVKRQKNVSMVKKKLNTFTNSGSDDNSDNDESSGENQRVHDYSKVQNFKIVIVANTLNMILNEMIEKLIRKLSHQDLERFKKDEEKKNLENTVLQFANSRLMPNIKIFVNHLYKHKSIEHLFIKGDLASDISQALFMLIFNYIVDKYKLFTDPNHMVDYYIDNVNDFFINNTLEVLLSPLSNLENTFNYNDKEYTVIQYNWGKMIDIEYFHTLFPGEDISKFGHNMILCILKNSDKNNIGYITATYKFTDNLDYYIKIEMVSVSERFRSGGTCKVLLHSLLNYVDLIAVILLNDLKPKMYKLYNAGGYISCYCYTNFFTRLNYKIFRQLDDPSNETKYPITSALCNNNRNDYFNTMKKKIRQNRGLNPNNKTITNNNVKKLDNKDINITHKSASTMYFIKD